MDNFIEEVYEIAFGDNAINKGYSPKEVINKLKEFSEKSWRYDELG